MLKIFKKFQPFLILTSGLFLLSFSAFFIVESALAQTEPSMDQTVQQPTADPAIQKSEERPRMNLQQELLTDERKLEIMENAVDPAVLQAFKEKNPKPFWLFGEDRQLQIRNNIVPAHWFATDPKDSRRPFDSTDDIRDFPRSRYYVGSACPGEFYVFQVAVLSEKARHLTFEFKDGFPLVNSNNQNSPRNMNSDPEKIISLKPTFITQSPTKVDENGCKPIWLGFQIPEDAQNKTVRGTVIVKDSDSGEEQALRTVLFIQNDPVVENGVHDPWRLARLKWLDSEIGMSETEVTDPFIPLAVDENSAIISLLGRTVQLSPLGIPAQYTSNFSGSNTKITESGRSFYSAAPVLSAKIGDKKIVWKNGLLKFTKKTPTRIEWTSVAVAEGIKLSVFGQIQFDGFISLDMKLTTENGKEISVDEVRFEFEVPADVASYFMGINRQGGFFPKNYSWKWNTKFHQDAIWMGDINIGTLFRLKGDNYSRPLINAYYDFKPILLPESWGGGGIDISKTETGKVAFYSGAKTLGENPLNFKLDMYLTPFKTINPTRHFNDRYYHAGIGNPPEPGLDKVKALGANTVILHHNQIQNPYINYPYNSDSFELLKTAVNAAHNKGMRLKIYYTTRELTQNLPEFFALDSLDGEIFMPRKEGVKWPVTNSNGPHEWLTKHVGSNFVPAWKEAIQFKEYPNRLDLAVLTTPDTRWNNFFLEGLDYLVKNAKIDGIYVDDTALNRESMQRARRILDADGNTGRRIDTHSWSHFNNLAGMASSAMVYSELYPFVDSLWYGEGFNYDTPPEYWIVEMSGLPFGLMSQMLQGGGNPWRGLVFGMTCRQPWSGNMTELWKFFDQVNFEESGFIGYWDKENPVQSTTEKTLVSTYVQKNRVILALGNFTANPLETTLTIDLKQLAKVASNSETPATIKSVEVLPIEKFQDAATLEYSIENGVSSIPVSLEGKRGKLIVVEFD